MTDQIKGAVRKNRRWMGAVALGVSLTTALVFFAIPAVAIVDGPVFPRSKTEGVVPIERNLGGQNGDCVSVGSAARYPVRITDPANTPVTTTTLEGRTVTITTSTTNVGGEQYLAFAITGAAAYDVVIKGGSNSAHYAYNASQAASGTPDPWSTTSVYAPARSAKAVRADNFLHATRAATGSKKLYTVSHVSFCLDTVASISGKVWKDADADGHADAGEAPNGGWIVNLYSGTDPAPVQTTTLEDGSYSFNARLGSSYRVCAVVPPDESWFETSPLPGATGTAACSAEDELGLGYAVSDLSENVTGRDFGAVNGTEYSCGVTNTVGNMQFSFPCGTKFGDEYAFFVNGYTDENGQRVLIQAVPQPAATASDVAFLEKITWTFSGNTQNPVKVFFDDSFPYTQLIEMKVCNFDPRTGVDSMTPFESTVAGILPTYSPASPGVASDYRSCVLASTERAPTTSGGTGTYVAYIYSEADALRGTQP